MPQPNDLSRSLVALDQDSTIIAVVEMSQSSWLVGGVLLRTAAGPIRARVHERLYHLVAVRCAYPEAGHGRA